MKRKIIKQKTAYTLTLPISWIREHNINPKDEVEIEEDTDALVIRTEKKPHIEEITLTLEKGTTDYYRIMIENHYLKGYDIINLKFSDRKTFSTIQKIISNLIGFEILDQKENSCKIGATSLPSAEQFRTLLTRCFNIIYFTQNTVKEDIDKLSFPNLLEIETNSSDSRRFLLFCTRALHKISIVSRRNESFMHLLLERLILIEHNHYYLYQKISRIRNPKVRKEVKGIYGKAIEMFNIFKEMFYKKDLKNFAIINKYWEDIYFMEGYKLFDKCTEEESIIIYHSMYLSKLVFLISQPNLVMLEVK